MSVSRLGSVLRQIDVLFRDGTLCGLSDRELVDRFRERSERSEAAFAGLVERHGPMVRGVCRSVLTNPSDVDDAFQATFLVLVRRVGSVWVRDSIGPWLYNVANRVALRSRADAIRRKSREEGSATREHFLVEEGQDRSERSETARLVHEELARLPERWRGPIVLCHLEGMTHEQASRSLGVPVGTVRSRLSRGRERLKDRLIRRGLAPAVAWTASGISLGGEGSAAVVSGSLVQKTVSAGIGLASGWTLAGPVSVSTFQLTQGVLMSMFLTKAKTAALIFAIGGTTMGVSMKAGGFGIGDQRAPTAEVAVDDTSHEPPSSKDAKETGIPTSSTSSEPRASEFHSISPLQSTVRIHIFGSGHDTFALGTVISSANGESIALTAGLPFKLEGLPQPEASNFPKRIDVEQFAEDERDPEGEGPAKRSFRVGTPGTLAAYDLGKDLALIRFSSEKPKHPTSPIVPKRWMPAERMSMRTIACSGVNNPAIWTIESRIIKPIARVVTADSGFEKVNDAIECTTTPKSGSVGTGLFTADGYLAGVYKSVTPEKNRGYYTLPAALYAFLDRNGLKHLYDRPIDLVSAQPRPSANSEFNPRSKPSANPDTDSLEKPAANPDADPRDKPSASPVKDPFDKPSASPRSDSFDAPAANHPNEPLEKPATNPGADPRDQPLANPDTDPLEKPAANPNSKPQPKTPFDAFDDWLKGARKDLGSAERTVTSLAALLKEITQREKELNAEMQRLQKTKKEVWGMLHQAEMLNKSRLPSESEINDASPKQSRSPFDLDAVEAKKPSSPDVEVRLKDVEQKLERMLKLLEKANGSPKDGLTPPSNDSNRDSSSS